MAKDIINFKGGKGTVYWVVIAIVVIAIIAVLLQVYKASKLASVAAGDIAGDAIISNQTGVSVDRIAVCRQIAVDCREGMYIVFGRVIWVTDNDVVEALNRCRTPNEAILVSQFFREITGNSLKQIVESGIQNLNRITYRTSLT